MPKYVVFIPFVTGIFIMLLLHIICMTYDKRTVKELSSKVNHITRLVYYTIYVILGLISVAIALLAWFSGIAYMSKRASYVRVFVMCYPLIYLASVSLASNLSKHFISIHKWRYRLTYMNIPLWVFTVGLLFLGLIFYL